MNMMSVFCLILELLAHASKMRHTAKVEQKVMLLVATFNRLFVQECQYRPPRSCEEALVTQRTHFLLVYLQDCRSGVRVCECAYGQ